MSKAPFRKWAPPTRSWQNRSDQCIAQGALTNSKRPAALVDGVYPTHLSQAKGCFVWDTEGRQYIDFICGLGSSILGHAHDEVTDAICAQARRGTTLSLATPIEVECAEKVKELFPFIERLRFLKTGSDACSAAVRIARASNPRAPYVLSEGYHGHHDAFVSLTPPAAGCFRNGEVFNLRDVPVSSRVAAVIVEPIMTDASQARIAWLRLLRRRCTEVGAALIFDEVITGCRVPGYSVAAHYGVEPDLICLGKAVANGMPLSVVGGRRAIMDAPDWFVSSTFAGETLSLAAATTTLRLLQTKYSLGGLWERGRCFLDRFNALGPDLVHIDGYPTRGVLAGDPLNRALFMQEACKAGLLFGPSFFFNFSHLDVVDEVLDTAADIFLRLRSSQIRLEGAFPATPFSMKVRGSNE